MDKYAAEHILGLTGEYDAARLKAAYRTLAAIHHPDAAEAHGINRETATHKMQEINEAKDYLDPLIERWGPTLTCEANPAAPDGPEMRGVSWAPPPPTATRAYNPFEGSRPGAADRRKRRESTSEYYWNDPRFRPGAASAKRHAQQAAQGQSKYYNGEYESFSQKPQPEPKENPVRPFPKWYLPLWRFFAIFPYRFLFLLLVCLLVSFSDPFGTSARLGFISFEDTLILLALANLVRPFLTSPIRSACLWIVDRLRDLAWKIRGV
ncbi:MAG: J domain-containing protein [Coriobacteriia bacterium]|nr:J domain-containing protein [Coriobacteriia bacterium]